MIFIILIKLRKACNKLTQTAPYFAHFTATTTTTFSLTLMSRRRESVPVSPPLLICGILYTLTGSHTHLLKNIYASSEIDRRNATACMRPKLMQSVNRILLDSLSDFGALSTRKSRVSIATASAFLYYCVCKRTTALAAASTGFAVLNFD